MLKKFAALFGAVALALSLHAETPLEKALLEGVRDDHFDRVVDFGAGNDEHPVKAHLKIPAPSVADPLNVNVAVIQFGPDGRMVDRACVLLSRDYPDGLIVPLDENLGTTKVHFLRW